MGLGGLHSPDEKIHSGENFNFQKLCYLDKNASFMEKGWDSKNLFYSGEAKPQDIIQSGSNDQTNQVEGTMKALDDLLPDAKLMSKFKMNFKRKENRIFDFLGQAYTDIPMMPHRSVVAGHIQLEMYAVDEQTLSTKEYRAALANKLLVQGDEFFRKIAKGDNHACQVIPEYWGTVVYKDAAVQIFENTVPYTIGASVQDALKIWVNYVSNVFQFHRLTGCALNNIGMDTMSTDGRHSGSLRYIMPMGESMMYPSVYSTGKEEQLVAGGNCIVYKDKQGNPKYFAISANRSKEGTQRTQYQAKKCFKTYFPPVFAAKTELNELRSCKENDYIGLINILYHIMACAMPNSTMKKVKGMHEIIPSRADKCADQLNFQEVFYYLLETHGITSAKFTNKSIGLDYIYKEIKKNGAVIEQKEKDAPPEKKQAVDSRSDANLRVLFKSQELGLGKYPTGYDLRSSFETVSFITGPGALEMKEFQNIVRKVIGTTSNRSAWPVRFEMTTEQRLGWYDLITSIFRMQNNGNDKKVDLGVLNLVFESNAYQDVGDEIRCLQRLFGTVNKMYVPQSELKTLYDGTFAYTQDSAADFLNIVKPTQDNIESESERILKETAEKAHKKAFPNEKDLPDVLKDAPKPGSGTAGDSAVDDKSTDSPGDERKSVWHKSTATKHSLNLAYNRTALLKGELNEDRIGICVNVSDCQGCPFYNRAKDVPEEFPSMDDNSWNKRAQNSIGYTTLKNDDSTLDKINLDEVNEHEFKQSQKNWYDELLDTINQVKGNPTVDQMAKIGGMADESFPGGLEGLFYLKANDTTPRGRM